ncbi:hypothetical protein JNB62_05535 [Microbacterium jejuense]|uniref:Helix-turn-helix domain-containing protein n=1 Tax=Microbacterium jejuense TaxID=1263637 RepID=A0ABS7HJZ0_9MICO|nr:helix-turn-helix domain-containing protein [Microbacterium jejuense]MBW9093138.1 hypothetical protein [Microbacterium jejuense]
MGITRGRLAIDEHFTAVPNEWARDARLSRRARGLLVEVMSHRVGWHVTIRSLANAGKEGRDAIQSALTELLEHGYVKRSQTRAGGKFAEIEYELCDPPTVAGFPVHGETVSGFPVSGESATKKNISSEDHLSEDQPQELSLIAAVSFEDFWAVWPKKVAKPDALRAWTKATKKVAGERIVEAAIAYRDNPGIPDRLFIPYPATWLNRAGWDDELPQPRGGGVAAPDARVLDGIDRGRRLAALAEAQQGELTA